MAKFLTTSEINHHLERIIKRAKEVNTHQSLPQGKSQDQKTPTSQRP